MTQEQITEGNKLIAEFMNLNQGWAFHESDKSRFEFPNSIANPKGYTKYHEDWNWLMPVCKKILVLYHDNRQGMFSGLHNCDIEETFNGVVEFINFWNDPKQKKLTWKS